MLTHKSPRKIWNWITIPLSIIGISSIVQNFFDFGSLLIYMIIYYREITKPILDYIQTSISFNVSQIVFDYFLIGFSFYSQFSLLFVNRLVKFTHKDVKNKREFRKNREQEDFFQRLKKNKRYNKKMMIRYLRELYGLQKTKIEKIKISTKNVSIIIIVWIFNIPILILVFILLSVIWPFAFLFCLVFIRSKYDGDPVSEVFDSVLIRLKIILILFLIIAALSFGLERWVDPEFLRIRPEHFGIESKPRDIFQK